MRARNLPRLVSVAFRSPVEFYDRVAAKFSIKSEGVHDLGPQYMPISYAEALTRFANALDVDIAEFANECSLSAIEANVQHGIQRLDVQSSFPTYHNGDFALGRMCYIAVRAIRPSIVVETGVAYGVTTSFVLAALAENGFGHLHSVDLPPLGDHADDFVGVLVPDRLRSRWTLHRGTSRRVFPALFSQLPCVNLFIHDSLHTSDNIRFELEYAYSRRCGTLVAIADDIQGNFAFREWTSSTEARFHAAIAESNKEALLGVAISD